MSLSTGIVLGAGSRARLNGLTAERNKPPLLTIDLPGSAWVSISPASDGERGLSDAGLAAARQFVAEVAAFGVELERIAALSQIDPDLRMDVA